MKWQTQWHRRWWPLAPGGTWRRYVCCGCWLPLAFDIYNVRNSHESAWDTLEKTAKKKTFQCLIVIDWLIDWLGLILWREVKRWLFSWKFPPKGARRHLCLLTRRKSWRPECRPSTRSWPRSLGPRHHPRTPWKRLLIKPTGEHGKLNRATPTVRTGQTKIPPCSSKTFAIFFKFFSHEEKEMCRGKRKKYKHHAQSYVEFCTSKGGPEPPAVLSGQSITISWITPCCQTHPGTLSEARFFFYFCGQEVIRKKKFFRITTTHTARGGGERRKKF